MAGWEDLVQAQKYVSFILSQWGKYQLLLDGIVEVTFVCQPQFVTLLFCMPDVHNK